MCNGAEDKGIGIMFKIFYSWQSDLPSKKTRSFIRTCIDEAIDLALDSETIEAIRDEATLGVTGSPDIVTTLFSKIDECDLFIADVSLCFTEDREKVKKSPNPNVLLELGYAVKTLTWARVLCIANTDFGDVFPFDFDHNRRIAYSLEGNNRDNEKNRVSRIIFKNIRDLRNAPPRARMGMAAHIIGAYDYEKKKVTRILAPLKIGEQEGYVLHNQELVTNSKKLVEEIKEIKIIDRPEEEIVQSKETQDEKTYKIAQYFHSLEAPVRIDANEERDNIRRWLDIEVDDEFFNCGALKFRPHLLDGSKEYIGTDEEKLKFDKLTELFYYLAQLNMRSLFIDTFSGMIYIPLAIQNISGTDDQNIRVVVRVFNGEIVNPNKELICDGLSDVRGHICRDEDENGGIGVIDELFALSEDGTIHLEESAYDASNNRFNPPVIVNGRLQYPGKDEQDYEDELQEYVASSAGLEYYEFNVDSLRPNECRWLSQGLLVKPNEGFNIRYQIHSAHSSGDLSGELKL